MNENITSGAETVEGIPVRWVAPITGATGTALWLTHLGGSAEQTVPILTRLAERGLLAVSFDPPEHGRRGDGSSPERLTGEILASFRQRMWPLLGHTVLECVRVLDWAGDRFGVPGPLVAGVVSMGGDAAVAHAGIDHRVSRVGAIVATPDWTGPAMRTLSEHPEVIDQDQADGYARWFYEALNPMTHLEAYDRGLLAWPRSLSANGTVGSGRLRGSVDTAGLAGTEPGACLGCGRWITSVCRLGAG